MAAMLLQEPLIQAAIWDALNNYCYRDATFLAERLVAEVKTSDEALFLLATCYYRMGKPVQAYMLLQKRGCPTPQCKYLLALCCVEINKVPEAEEILIGNIFQSKKKSYDEIEAEYSNIACHVFSLLGRIYSKTERLQKAIECYKKSLKLNPLLWSSFEMLCQLGDKSDPAQVFHAPTQSQLLNTPMSQMSFKNLSNLQSPILNLAEMFESRTPMPDNAPPLLTLCDFKNQTPQPHPTTPFTPSFGMLPLETPGQISFITPSPTALTDSNNTLDTRAPSKKPVTRRSQQTGIQNNPPPVRKRTVKENKSPRGTGRNLKKNLGLNTLKGDFAGDITTKPLPPDTPNQNQILQMQHQSLCGVLNLYQGMGKAYQALTQYDCWNAIEYFQELPLHQYNTGYVLCHVGRAYFELAEYQKADRVFSEVRLLEPYHLEGMEIHSTTLWHLQKDVELSTLAQELSEMDKNSPEAWCATGNCFSLQKEHDTAIKFFQRAIQVDPSFAYAYTLLGHEYVFTEELDKAMSSFRNAIRVDPRHYNAWYGVGMIYFKQEKFTLAEVHFRKALLINPQSSALLCHIGVVQHAQQKSDSALLTLNRAIATDPRNPLCKFHRASILFHNDRHKEALAELEELKQIVPKESLVYFLIGKVHKKLGNSDLALMNFSWAMDLDPKGINNHETGPD